MTTWEYLILELPGFEAPTHVPGASAAVHALNEEGASIRVAEAHVRAKVTHP